MSTIDELKQAAAQEMERARALEALIFRIEAAIDDLAALGYTVTLGLTRAPVTFRAPAGQAAPVPEPEPPAPAPRKRSREPAPAAPPKPTTGLRRPPSEPELITGPLADDERDEAITMLARGLVPAEVARRLNRKAKQISNLKQNSKVRIAERAAELARTPPAARAASARGSADPAPPVAAEVPSPLPRDWPTAGVVLYEKQRAAMTCAEKEINAHLSALGYADCWTPAKDFDLVKALAGGAIVANVAQRLGMEKQNGIDRWKELNTRIGDLDHQHRLLRVLKLRANTDQRVAAE